jgi:ribose 5-phosphate isomerase RpiB
MIALGQQVTGVVTAQLMVKAWLANLGGFDQKGRSAPKVQRIIDYAREHNC